MAYDYVAHNDASLARLIKQGAIFIRPIGSPAPDGPDWVPGEDAAQIGYYSTDGFSAEPSPGETVELTGHNADVVVSEAAGGSWTLKFSAIEARRVVIETYFDATVNAEDGSLTLTTAAANSFHDLVLVGVDQASRGIIVHAPKVQVSARDAVTFNTSTLVASGLTFKTFMGSTPTLYHMKAWGLVPGLPEPQEPSEPGSGN
jgi:hypothetical protein